MMIQFKVENHQVDKEEAHPCVSVYIEAEFEPESDEDFVSGKECNTSLKELLPSNPNDKPIMLSTVKTKSEHSGWGDDSTTYKF